MVYNTTTTQQKLCLSKEKEEKEKETTPEAFWITTELTLHIFISLLLNLKPGPEERQDRSRSPPGPLAHLPLLHEKLLQLGAA